MVRAKRARAGTLRNVLSKRSERGTCLVERAERVRERSELLEEVGAKRRARAACDRDRAEREGDASAASISIGL